MALFKTQSAAVYGIDAHRIDVEVDMYSYGSPRDSRMVGMPDVAVRESRERIKSALINSGFGYPNKTLTINLAPASVRKEGGGFDLPVALGILGAMGVVKGLDQHILTGELSLDGAIRPIRGALSIAVCARAERIPNLILPAENAAEAAVVELSLIHICTLVVAITSKRGDYLWHYEGTAFEIGANSLNASTAFMQQGLSGLTANEAPTMGMASQSGYEALAFAQGSGFGVSGCILRAAGAGLVSSAVDLSDHKLTQNPQLPDIILTRPSASEGLEITEAATVPKAAQKEWLGGMTALRSTKWDEAETHLRAAVDAAPGFGLGWSALALAYHNLHKSAEARDALEHAIKVDPKSPSLRFRLMRTEMDLKDWKAAATTAAALTQACLLYTSRCV